MIQKSYMLILKAKLEMIIKYVQAHYIIFIFLLFLSTCTVANYRYAMNRLDERKKMKLIKNINCQKLNYVTRYSYKWREYAPNLINAQGWIIKNCSKDPKKEILSEKVVVDSMDVKHYYWGDYRGTLYGRFIKNNQFTMFSYECFKPDYTFGDWNFISERDFE